MGSYLIAEFTVNGLLETLWTILKVALGLGFVIFVHELGHFLAAKLCGVKCEKFYVGFDPPMKYLPSSLAKFQWGETEYGIGIIPLGGYVKMLGQDDNPSKAAAEAERAKIVTTNEAGEKVEKVDPRSYVAKPVWQRMIIISAGVIMNLVSAVLIAAVAYRMGVSYMPVEIAGTSPGDPAWVQGLQPGDKVIQIGRRSEVDETMRWKWEFTQRVLKAGIVEDEPVEPLDLLIRSDDGSQQWVTITPTRRQQEILDTVSVGVRSISSNRLISKRPVVEHMAAGKASPEFQPGDRIIAVNGQPLPQHGANEKGDLPATEIERMLWVHLRSPVTMTVERTEKGSVPQELQITVPPNPLRSTGLVMKMGPVVGVRKGSPAEQAGFKVGDVLLRVDGQAVGDPLTLPQRLPERDTLDFAVLRDGKEVALQCQQQRDAWNAPYYGPGARMSLETVGLAYSISRKVARVLPGSPAAELKDAIRPGDEITYFEVIAEGSEKQKQAKEALGPRYDEPLELDDEVYNWTFISGNRIQEMGPGIDLQLTLMRGGEKHEVRVGTYERDDAFFDQRGLRFAPLQRIHRAENWLDATQLGFRETKEKVVEVWQVLTLLVTGRLSLNNLGGPVLIATVAGSEASQGIPRLLLFLTFLSANLAILNFLPIPVLDGGHMVFLFAEGIIGKPVPERIQMTATFIGFCALMALMVFVFTNDIARFFGP